MFVFASIRRWLLGATAMIPALGGVAPAAPPVPAVPAAATAAPVQPEYRIGPGDELSVTFPYNAELNHDGPVGPDGRFTMPQVGNIALADRTIDQATAIIAAALQRSGIVEDAHPSLTIRQYGASVFVGGEVRQPGAVRLVSGMDAMQAVIVAGGALETARTRRIIVIRRLADGGQTRRVVDLRAYVRHGVAAGAEPLRSQDIVFVPRSSIAEVDLWVDQYLNRTLPFSKSLNYSLGNGSIIRP